MSFMYNPFPFDDPRPVNRPALAKETIEGVTCGTLKSASKLAAEFAGMLKDGRGVVVAIDRRLDPSGELPFPAADRQRRRDDHGQVL